MSVRNMPRTNIDRARASNDDLVGRGGRIVKARLEPVDNELLSEILRLRNITVTQVVLEGIRLVASRLNEPGV